MKKGKILKTIAVVCTVGILSTGLLVKNASAETHKLNMKRLAGKDRFETAIQVSNEFRKTKCKYPKTTRKDVAILCNAFTFADSTAAAPLVHQYNAPILLSEKDKLNPKTEAQLKKLGIKKVLLIGGKGVLSDNVDKRLKSMGISTERIGGENRYQTSLEIAKKITDVREIFFVEGDSYINTLSVAPMTSWVEGVMILIPHNKNASVNDIKGLEEYVQKCKKDYHELRADLISKDDSALNLLEEAEKKFNMGIVWCKSYNKYLGNLEINSVKSGKLNFENVLITTGENFPDALAGTALSVKMNAPVVFIGNDLSKTLHLEEYDNPNEYKRMLFEDYESTENVFLLGGKKIVPEGSEKRLYGEK